MRKILLGVALAVFATTAFAQDKRPDYGPDVNAAGAKKIAAGVLAECQKNGWNVAVAVVDNHGFLVYFERMDNTQTASMDIAVGKARAAATYRRPTRVFMEVINKGGPATGTLPGVFASPGGLPIMVSMARSSAASASAAPPATRTSNAPRPVSAARSAFERPFSA